MHGRFARFLKVIELFPGDIHQVPFSSPEQMADSPSWDDLTGSNFVEPDRALGSVAVHRSVVVTP